MAEHLALVDLGSNSVRMVIMALHRDGSYKLVDEIKESVRLSENMGPEKTLKEPAIARTIETLKLFRRLCQANRIDQVIAVATAAVRQAANGPEFLALMERETGFCFRVLSGEEEARYVFTGVINTLNYADGLIVDIGGGSTELVLFRQRQIAEAISLPFGAVTLSEAYQLKEKSQPQQLSRLEVFLAEALQGVPWLDQARGLPLIGLGGTVRNLGKIDRKGRGYSLDITHNYVMATEGVEKAYQSLRVMNVEARRKVPGLSRDRADIIVGGAAILRQLILRSQVGEVVVSGSGLREGLFYDYYLKKAQLARIEDVLYHSVRNMMGLYRVLEPHARKVAALSLQLFDQLAPLHGCGGEWRRILEVAALLHDIGIAISYYDHHRHSFYLIANSRMNGLSHRQILLTAFLAAAHRNGQVKGAMERHRDLISSEDWQHLRYLAVLLALAEALDRSEGGTVEGLEVQIEEKTVWIKTCRQQEAELEIAEAMGLANPFKKIFKRTLQIL